MNKIIHPIEPEELMAYLDGELSSDQTAIAAAHLSKCAECSEAAVELKAVSQTLKNWEVAVPESTTPPAIEAAIDKRGQERVKLATNEKLTWREVFSTRWGIAEWAGALALVGVVVIGGVRFIGRDANNVSSTFSPRNSASSPQGVELQSPSPAAAPAASIGAVDKMVESSEMIVPPPPPPPPARPGEAKAAPLAGPMVIRTAQLALINKDFDTARASVEAILKRHRGYTGQLQVGGSAGSGRTLTATLRVPADQLDASLADLKTLGRVASESQSGQDVTSQYVDLQARLANARITERRLTDMLRERTGKLSDVLEVEQEVDRVRGEIEQMEAERKNMSNQVSFATLNVTVTEDYKAQLQVVPPSTWTRLSNAAVAGYKSMVEGVVSLALFLLEIGPSLLLWIGILFLPARLVWKKARRGFAQ